MVLALCGLVGAVAIGADDKKADDKKFTYLDLQPKANHKLKDSLHNRTGNNNLAELKDGEQTLEGVKFKIGEKLLQLGSTNLQDMPEKIEGIKVDKTFAKLHILQATGWFAEDDAIIGEYTVTWDDDTSTTIPIRYGKDVLDWWFDDNSPEPSEAKVAWKGENEDSKAGNKKVRLYMTTWENPKPDKKVVSIDFSTTKQTQAAPFCVALTIETK
jgi:hypothetical protein